jgi:eukaryotic-like serine/threonine-protein kinase
MSDGQEPDTSRGNDPPVSEIDDVSPTSASRSDESLGELVPLHEEPGTLLKANDSFGRYRVVRDLATGGMAQVFLASLKGPDGFEKLCVIKRILPQYARVPGFSQMFINEAKIAAMMSHQNIVQTFEFSKENDSYFLAMEYVAGASLERSMRTAKKLGMQGDLKLALEVGLGMANALDYAHRFTRPDGTPLNIVHRDISPENILLSRDGGVKLTDFGVVKADLNDNESTVAGVVKGKWSYMSPEQISSHPVDARSDLFSLGIVLYEVATGKRLFRGASLPATIDAVLRGEVVRPSLIHRDFPTQFERILLKSLERLPQKRYQSGAELAADLEQFRAQAGLGSGHVAQVVNHLFPRDGTQPGAYLVSSSSAVSRTDLGVSASPEVDDENEALSFHVEEVTPHNKTKRVLLSLAGLLTLALAAGIASVVYTNRHVEVVEAPVVLPKVEEIVLAPTANAQERARFEEAKTRRAAGVAALEAGDYARALINLTEAKTLIGEEARVDDLLKITEQLRLRTAKADARKLAPSEKVDRAPPRKTPTEAAIELSPALPVKNEARTETPAAPKSAESVERVQSAGSPTPAPEQKTDVVLFGAGMTPPVYDKVAFRVGAYTREARAAKVQGSMILRCDISIDGTVKNCAVLKALPFLADSVKSKLEQTKVGPVTFQGVPTAVKYTFNFQFVLQ